MVFVGEVSGDGLKFLQLNRSQDFTPQAVNGNSSDLL